MFRFRGEILPSKSWLNRAQIIKHFNPQIRLPVDTAADDVRSLHTAIQSIGQDAVFDLGLGGTSFRFFTFLISRHPGKWLIKAHRRLLERPQQDMLNLLQQLGVQARLSPDGLNLFSDGWKLTSEIEISAESSSQFLSGLLLSCWDLPQDLRVRIRKPVVSYSYLQMTLQLLSECGMHYEQHETEAYLALNIPAHQVSDVSELRPEIDVSSAFSLAAAAVVSGEVEITNWKHDSVQPDMEFIRLFREMGIPVELTENTLRIRQQSQWKSLSCDLNQTPDLFPVLAVLCALGAGTSVLSGAQQLKNKESDRIAKTAELLKGAGFQIRALPDGMEILGRSSVALSQNEFIFDPSEDHRMAMAAGILKLAGYNIHIQHPGVVNKSYPDFWRHTGVQP